MKELLHLPEKNVQVNGSHIVSPGVQGCGRRFDLVSSSHWLQAKLTSIRRSISIHNAVSLEEERNHPHCQFWGLNQERP